MALYLYDDLVKRLNKILEPRYEALFFENGSLIPTMTDLVAGIREIAYERFMEAGDADFMEDAGTNIPVVDISRDEDRYPVYMVGSGFAVSFQEERTYASSGTTAISMYDRRMAAARRAIAERTDRATAAGVAGLNFPSAMNYPNVPIEVSSFNPYTAGFSEYSDFLVNLLEGLTDNFVSQVPSTLLVSSDGLKRMMSSLNSLGTTSIYQYIKDLYPSLEIQKIRQCSDAWLTQFGIPHATGHDRYFLYPKEPSVLHRHLEKRIAQLVPQDFIRVDGLRKIYTLYSCFTPTIIDYPTDCKYLSIMKKP